MKLRHIFLISCVLVLSVGTYLVLIWNPNGRADIGNANTMPSALSENSVVKKNPGKDASMESEMQENLVALRKEVALLKADVAALKQNMQTTLQQTGGKEKVAQATPALTEEELMAKEEEAYRKQAEDLETLFRQQTVDGVWSEQTKNMLQDALASDQIDINTVGIECRSSACRVELPKNHAHGKSPKMSQFQSKVSEEFPDIMTSQIKEADGSMTTVYYLSREEINLPDSGS
jgi:hypothetical protein